MWSRILGAWATFLSKMSGVKGGSLWVRMFCLLFRLKSCAMCGKRGKHRLMAFLVHICFSPFVSFMASHYSLEWGKKGADMHFLLLFHDSQISVPFADKMQLMSYILGSKSALKRVGKVATRKWDWLWVRFWLFQDICQLPPLPSWPLLGPLNSLQHWLARCSEIHYSPMRNEK